MMMDTELVCPDCGKYIAAEGEVEDLARCRCAEPTPRSVGSSVRAPEIRHQPPAQDTKICHVCGENVTGRQRYRDSIGRYWCADCREADERKNESRCPDCGKLFPPDRLFEFQLTRVCKSCYRTRINETASKITRMGHDAMHRREEISRIKWMSIVLAVLLAIATAHQIWG
jgi:hypothetical protein